MAVRNLAIRDEVYRKLLDAKADKESFSDVIDRLLSSRPKLSSFSGTFAGDKEFALVEEDRRRVRSMTVSGRRTLDGSGYLRPNRAPERKPSLH